MPQVQNRLVAAIHEIESLEVERRNYADLISNTLESLKEDGYDPKIVRKVVALRRKNRAEVEAEQHKIDELMMQLETNLAQV